jgi:hypothetical protein
MIPIDISSCMSMQFHVAIHSVSMADVVKPREFIDESVPRRVQENS